MIYYVDIYGSNWAMAGDLPELDSAVISEILDISKDSKYEIVLHIINEDPKVLIDWTTAEEYPTQRYLCFRLSEERYAEFLLTFS